MSIKRIHAKILALITFLIIADFIVYNLAPSIKATHQSNQVFNLTQKLPSALIIGAAKCGTSTILEFLSAHPAVVTKFEARFFDHYYDRGVEWYLRQMPLSSTHQITLEKTPDYFVVKDVPARVFKLNPRMKLIVVLRDPVTRVISHYVHLKTEAWHDFVNDTRRFNLTDSERIAELIYSLKEHEEGKSKGEICAECDLVRQSLYYDHIERWLEYFPLEQFVFVNGARLCTEPSTEIDKMQSFLDLEPCISREHFVFVPAKRFYCIRKPLQSSQLKCMGDDKGRKHPAIDSAIIDDLRMFYRASNRKLFNLINENPWWPI